MERDKLAVRSKKSLAEPDITFWSFAWLCVKRAVWHAWEKGDSIATAVVLVLGAIAYFIPELEQYMAHQILIVPFAALATVGVVRLVLSPYLIYKSLHKEAHQYEKALRDRYSKKELLEILDSQCRKGSDLKVAKINTVEELDSWVDRYHAWYDQVWERLITLGLAGEATLFDTADARGRIRYPEPTQDANQSNLLSWIKYEDERIEKHLDALREIIAKHS